MQATEPLYEVWPDGGMEFISIVTMTQTPPDRHAVEVVISHLEPAKAVLVPGSFERAMVDLCCHADAGNLQKLALAFPAGIPAAVAAWKFTSGGRARMLAVLGLDQ